MKKFATLLLVSLLIMSCGNNDDNNPVNTITNSSDITIEGSSFTPDPNTAANNNITTSFTTANDLNYRTFYLRKNNGDFIHVNLNYVGDEVSGTYTNDLLEPGQPYRVATGGVQLGDIYRSFIAGYSIVVSDLGNNKFRLEFVNVTAANIGGGGSPIDVEGYFEGQFVDEPAD